MTPDSFPIPNAVNPNRGRYIRKSVVQKAFPDLHIKGGSQNQSQRLPFMLITAELQTEGTIHTKQWIVSLWSDFLVGDLSPDALKMGGVPRKAGKV